MLSPLFQLFAAAYLFCVLQSFWSHRHASSQLFFFLKITRDGHHTEVSLFLIQDLVKYATNSCSQLGLGFVTHVRRNYIFRCGRRRKIGLV
jgi:hypothetical protein